MVGCLGIGDLLLLVRLLLQFEDVVYKEVVEGLVGEVDTELRKTIQSKVLETEDVENLQRSAVQCSEVQCTAVHRSAVHRSAV